MRSTWFALIAALAAVGARADVVRPVNYNAPNGGKGAFSYFDDTYIGPCRSPFNTDVPFCDQFVPYSPLSGGHGQLTDGLAVDLNWWRYPNTWVGWMDRDYTLSGQPCSRENPDCLPGLGAEPVVQFFFQDAYAFQLIQIHVDDADGAGGVSVPLKVELSDGETVLEYNIDDPAGPRPAWLTFDAAGLAGSTLLIKLFFRSAWIMVDEFRFYADVELPQPIPPEPIFLTGGGETLAQIDYDALVYNPEPSSLALMLAGGLALLVLRRRRS